MSKLIVCKKKGKALALSIFMIGLAVLSYTGEWWPGIMLAVGLPLALKHYLAGRTYDMAVALLVFIGVFVTVNYKIQWDILLPVLFTIGGIYIFCRDFLEDTIPSEEEKEEDLNEEIKEETHKE